jgi:hypothetical protein
VTERQTFYTISEREAVIHAYIDIPFKGHGWIKKIVPIARAEAWAKELLTYEDTPDAPSKPERATDEPDEEYPIA